MNNTTNINQFLNIVESGQRVLPLRVAYCSELGPLSGAYLYRPGKPALIVVNSTKPEVHQRLVIGKFFSDVHLQLDDPALPRQCFRYTSEHYDTLEAALEAVRLAELRSEFYELNKDVRMGHRQYEKAFAAFLATKLVEAENQAA